MRNPLAVSVGVLLTGALFATPGGRCRASEPPQRLAAGAWSKPVADKRGAAVRGRLVLYEKPRKDRREVVVFVELQDATESVGRTLRLFCDLGKTDFRPAYKGGLNCQLRDKHRKPVKSTPFPFSGAVPGSEWVTLPSDSTIRLRATPFGVHRRAALAISPHLGQLWIIDNTDPNEYFLSGTFTINPPADRVPAGKGHVWRGTIPLSAVRITNRRK